MKIKKKFIIHLHLAKRAGKHYDIRFQMPDSKLWASFATKKEIPLKTGIKRMVIRTHDHSEKEALMVGTIESGYGAGELKVWDQGSAIIEKFTNPHMIVNFNGKKIKGRYHFINMNQITRKSNKERAYLFFKGKDIKVKEEVITKKELENLYEKIDNLVELNLKKL